MRKVRYIGYAYFPFLTIGKVYDVVDSISTTVYYLDKICIEDDNGNRGDYFIYDFDKTIMFEEAIAEMRNDAIDEILL